MNIKQFIEYLEDFPQDTLIHGVTNKFHSYRGYYESLAMDLQDYNSTLLVSELIQCLKEQVGRTYQGYKGGNYTMSEHTALYVASYGCLGESIVGVELCDGKYYIETADYE